MDIGRVDMKDVECFYCHKKGHIQRDCHALKNQNRQARPMQTRQADVPSAQQLVQDMSDDTLAIFARAVQSAADQRASGSGTQAKPGFRRVRK